MKEHNTLITPESVLAEVKEMFAEVRGIFAESRAEFDKEMKESRAEFNRKMEESRAKFDRKSAEFYQQLKESSDRFDREMKESREDWKSRMKNLNEHMGGVANSQGLFSEEYFFNSFKYGRLNLFGEEFDEIWRNERSGKKGSKSEYDLLLINGNTVGIIEIKFKAGREYITELIKKTSTFRVNFPQYQNHKLYIALAAMVFDARLELECIKEGIAVIKQVDDTLVFYDEHIKAF